MKTWNEIKQEIITNFPDNNNKEITAERLRTTLTDIANTSIDDKNEAISNFHYYDDEISNMVESLNDYATLSYVNENYYTKSEVNNIIDEQVLYLENEDTTVLNNCKAYTESYCNTNYYDKQYISDFKTNVDNTTDDLDNRLSGVEDHINESNNIVVGTERKIGAWTEDGVTYDLYEKIVNFGELPNSDMKQVDHGVTNKVKFVYTKGDAIGQNSLSIPFVNDNGSLYIYMGVGNTKITITTNSDRSNLNGYITLRYIRTRG